MGQEYYLEFPPPCGGVTWVVGLCRCSRIKVKAYVDWGVGRLKVWLDGEEVVSDDATSGHWIENEIDIVPEKTFSHLTVGVSDPECLAISQIEVWYTCENLPISGYLEYLPPCGGVNFVIAPCNCAWIRAEAIVDWGLGRFKVWLDGEEAINEDAAVGHWVVGEASFEPPKPITNITVGVSDPATVGLREIRVWYACGPVEDAFQLLMVVIDQRIVEQGDRAEARVRWRNLSQYAFWTNLRLGVHCRGDWYYGDWIYAEAPPGADATTDVWAPVKADWPYDALIDARLEELHQGIVWEVDDAYSTPLTETDYHDFRAEEYW